MVFPAPFSPTKRVDFSGSNGKVDSLQYLDAVKTFFDGFHD